MYLYKDRGPPVELALLVPPAKLEVGEECFVFDFTDR